MKLYRVKVICNILTVLEVLLIIWMGLTKSAVCGYIAIGLLAVFGVITVAFWRCPHCGKSPGHLTAKFCPHCGGDLEEE